MKHILVLVFVFGYVYAQTVNNVRLVGHIEYMTEVLQEVVNELERREWCNLKVPDITAFLDETVIDREYEGTVTYSNGFLASMQQVDIRREGVDQVWSWNSEDDTATVLTRATLRLHDVQLGYDVVAELQDGHHRYTMTVTYPLILYLFNMRRNVFTDVTTSEVIPTITTATIDRIKFLPVDNTTDVLTTLFNLRAPEEGLTSWGQEVFAPIALHAVNDLVEFPVICYDCPA